MEHISQIMAHMVESDHFKQAPVIHYCPVEKRTVDSDYCDSINCEMCGDDECLGYDPRDDEDNHDVDMDPELIVQHKADMNYELLCDKYFD